MKFSELREALDSGVEIMFCGTGPYKILSVVIADTKCFYFIEVQVELLCSDDMSTINTSRKIFRISEDIPDYEVVGQPMYID